ncbi:MAG: S-methyl-5-thioribose-1-phosphate isomerase [Elusimicrobiota bacterium]
MFETIVWKKDKLLLIDQTLLPVEYKIIECHTVQEVWEAIKTLKVRGAPAIGIAGAFGAYLGVREINLDNYKEFSEKAFEILDYLWKCRPTAVNLHWALDSIAEIIKNSKNENIVKIKQKILQRAEFVLQEDRVLCRKIGENGEKFIKNNSVILTHCNAGGLATSGYGTALAVIYMAKEKGKKFKVFADETRPLLQGARLTAWELKQNNIDVTVICDNMAGHVIRDKGVDMVIVGADRITANGDTANKIGTYSVAVLAEKHKIPFYVAAPFSTFDFNLKTGADIPIEERDHNEIIKGLGKQIVPDGVNVYNPAFDVTPAELITGIITDKGVFRAPYEESLKNIK